MASNYPVTFSILGNLDPSLQNALKGASDKIKSLGDLAKSINPKAISQARTLAKAQATLKQVEAYNKLSGAIRTNQSALAANLLLASKQRAQQSAAVKQLGDMKVAYQRLNDYYKANRRSMGTDAAQVMKDQLKSAQAELRAQQRLVDDLGKQSEASSSKAAKLRETLASQQSKLTQLRSTLPLGINTSAEAALRAQIEATTQALNREIAAIERRNQVLANFSQANQDLSNAWSNFQSSLSTAATIMAPFKDAAENAMTFEKAMSRLKALTQMENIRSGNMAAVESEMASMTETIEHLGAASEYTANQIAGAANYYAMAGWNSKQINAVLPSTTDLASIAQYPIERVADMFSDDLTILGIKAGEQIQLANGKMVDAVQHTADAYAFAVTKANLNMEDLHTALTYNAGGLRLAGLSQGDIFGFNMILANAGLKGSKAGTALNTGVIRMMAPAKQGAQALESLGLTASEAQKEMAAAGEEMARLGLTAQSSVTEKIMAMKRAWDENKLAGNDDANAAMLNYIVGKNAFKGWAELLDSDKLEQALGIASRIDSGEIEGWSAQTAAIMRDNARTSIDYLTSALDALQRSAGQALTPAIRNAAEAFTPLVASAAQWVAQHPQIVQACAAIAASLAAATVAVAGFSLAMAGVRFAQAGFATAGLMAETLKLKAESLILTLRGLTLASIGSSLSSGLTAAATAMRTFGRSCLVATRAAMAFVFTPLGAALTAIALAGYWAYNNWDKVAPALKRIGDALSGVISPAIDSAVKSFQLLAVSFQPLGDVLGTLTNAVGGTLTGAFIGLGGTVASIIAGIIVGLAGLIKTVAGLGTGISKALEQFSKGDYSGAFATLSEAGNQAAKNYEAAWRDATGAVEKGLSATAQAMRDLTTTLPTAEVVARHRVEYDESGVAHSAPIAASNEPLVASNNSLATSSMEQVNASAQMLSSSLLMPLPALASLDIGSQLANAAMNQVASNSQQTAQAAQIAATSLEGVNNPAQTLSQSLMSASPATQALAYSAQAASASSDALSGSAINATGGIDALSGSAAGSTGSIDAMSGSASSASGSLGGLAAAVSSAIAGLYSAASSAAGVISSAASSAWSSIKGAVGLIGGGGGGFARGGLVESTTTFYAGEHGREMIIPLTEHHQRAVGLWQTAGRLLGIRNQELGTRSHQLLATSNYSLTPNINVSISVTINGNADEQVVRRGLESAMPSLRRSFAEELAAYRREQRRRSFA